MDLHTVKSVLGIGKYEHDSMVLWWSIFGALPVHFAISGVEYHHEVLEWFDTRVVKGCMGAIAGKCLWSSDSPWKHTNASHKLHRKRTEKMWITRCFIGRICYFCVSTFFQLRTERWPQFWSAIEKQPGREAISTPEAATLEFSGHFDLEGCSHNFLPRVDHFASQATHPVSSGFMSTPKGWIV